MRRLCVLITASLAVYSVSRRLLNLIVTTIPNEHIEMWVLVASTRICLRQMGPSAVVVRLSLIGRWARLNWDLWSKFIVSSRHRGPPTLTQSAVPSSFPSCRSCSYAPGLPLSNDVLCYTKAHNTIWQSGYCGGYSNKRKKLTTVASTSSRDFLFTVSARVKIVSRTNKDRFPDASRKFRSTALVKLKCDNSAIK